MASNGETLTDKAPNAISDAYWTFKGGSKVIGNLAATELLDVTHTARIQGTGDGRWCVKVFLNVDGDEVPEVVERAAEAHDLQEVKRDHNFDGTLDSVTYARK